jgi:hypothetical protein
MALTKVQVLALGDAQSNDMVAEQVMQWARLGSLKLADDSFNISRMCWAENLGNTAEQRGDGTVASVPNYAIRLTPPQFDSEEWSTKIMDKMCRRGFKMALERNNVTGDWSCSFTPLAGVPDAIVLSNPLDAIRRAALFAVQ